MAKKIRCYCNRAAFVRLAVLVLSLSAPLIFPGPSSATDTKIIIGTGSVAGVYYPAGIAICRAINKRVAEHKMLCAPKSTDGSVFNVDNIRSGDLNFGVVQSDVQYYAIKGFGPFKDKGPDRKLRAVFSLHSEPFTVLARADSGIRKFDDLKGKRVNIGNLGSGQRTSMDLVMIAKGWTKDDFASVMELHAEEQAKALCDDKIDAMVFTVGHPNASIKEASTSCNTVLVDVTGPAIVNLIKKYPYYSAVTIPGGLYKGSPHRTRTFGVTATVVTSSDTPDKVVHDLAQDVFENLVDFKFSHPAFFSLVPDTMVGKGQTAPLHPGAMLYYQEAGDLSHLLDVKRAPRR